MARPSFARFAQQYLAALLQDFGTVYLNEMVPRDPKRRVFELPSHDGWSKGYLGSLTADQPQVMISPKVTGEARLVDVLFEPHLADKHLADKHLAAKHLAAKKKVSSKSPQLLQTGSRGDRPLPWASWATC